MTSQGRNRRSPRLKSRWARAISGITARKAQEVVGRLKGLKSVVKPLEDAVRGSDDLAAMIEMAAEDEGMAAEVPGEIERLEKGRRRPGDQVAAERPAGPQFGPLDDQCPRRRHRCPRLGRDAAADVSGLGQGPRLRHRDPRSPGQRGGRHQQRHRRRSRGHGLRLPERRGRHPPPRADQPVQLGRQAADELRGRRRLAGSLGRGRRSKSATRTWKRRPFAPAVPAGSTSTRRPAPSSCGTSPPGS